MLVVPEGPPWMCCWESPLSGWSGAGWPLPSSPCDFPPTLWDFPHSIFGKGLVPHSLPTPPVHSQGTYCQERYLKAWVPEVESCQSDLGAGWPGAGGEGEGPCPGAWGGVALGPGARSPDPRAGVSLCLSLPSVKCSSTCPCLVVRELQGQLRCLTPEQEESQGGNSSVSNSRRWCCIYGSPGSLGIEKMYPVYNLPQGGWSLCLSVPS